MTNRNSGRVSFAKIHKGSEYSRAELASLWGYDGYQALAVGLFTPRDDNKIILFVTEEKQASSVPYADRLSGNLLQWETSMGHRGEARLSRAEESGDQLHLFYRAKHHERFTYLGQLSLEAYDQRTDRPSRLAFRLI